MLSLLAPIFAEARTLELVWKPNQEPDLDGYRVRYGTVSGNYTERINVGKLKTSATVENLSDTETYYFVVTAYNTHGLESRPSHELSYPSADEFRNLSMRGALQLDGVLISGFVISGNGRKKVMVRALGPSADVPHALSDPVLELHDISGGTIAANDDWRMGNEEAILASGAAPLDDKDAAVIVTLNAGAYTVVTRDASGYGGIGLVEIYDLDDARDTLRLTNSSARGSILTGNNILIGGVIIGRGDTRIRILARAVGPSLTSQGVAYALVDPTLQLYDGNGEVIASNDDWKDTQQQEIEAIGLAPSNDRESAIVAALVPGHYTAIVTGKNGGMGIGLVELYSLL